MQEPIVNLLAKQSRSRLKEMERQIDERVEDLLAQRLLVRRALAEQEQEQEEQSATEGRPKRALPSAPSKATRRKRSALREAITEIVRGDADRIWLPSEVREALAERGMQAHVEAVRVTLRRMGEAGELVRPAGGNGWRVAPPSNGATAQPAQSTWGPRGVP